MANLVVTDGASATKYLKATGAGSDLDPNIPQHLESNSAALLTAAQAIQAAAVAIRAAVETLDNIVLGSEAQVDVLTMPTTTVTGTVTATGPLTDTQLRATAVPVSGTVAATGPLTDTQLRATAVPISAASLPTVTIAALPAGTANIGDVDVLTLPALPAGTNNIGDVDVLTIAAGANIIGATYDAGFHTAYTVSRGVSGAVVTSADASAGVNITGTPTSGQKLVIVDLVFSVNVDMQVDFKEETSGTIFYTFYPKAGAIMQFTPRTKWKLATADKRLVADTSVAGACSFTPSYYSEA